MKKSIKIRSAKESDYVAIEKLLQSVDLPIEGVKEYLQHFIIMENDGKMIGVVGLEVYGNKALLRSLAVVGEAHGLGLGKMLYNKILEKARQLHVDEIYLLTETAEAFFTRQGFVHISRDAVDSHVKKSVEFQSVCPESAACMRLKL
ncbi:MAG: arsenic resistance N-acetyltransferase ArsN2 [bacterium]